MLDTTIKIAQALEVSINELIGGEFAVPGDVDSILWDCTAEEKSILTQNMKELKATLRHFRIMK